MTLDKQAGVPSGNAEGDTIAYTFLLTNTGSAALTSVSVSDPLVGAVSCPGDTLEPGATMTCTATYMLTQDDVDAGVVVNKATASGTPPTGDPVTAGDQTTTPIEQTSSITLVKSSDASGELRQGDRVTYRFEVTNTGSTTLTSIVVSDPMVGPVDCPADALAPAESMTCTAAAHVVSAQDAQAGQIVNVATVAGQSCSPTLDAGCQAVEDSDTLTLKVRKPTPDPVLPQTGSDASLTLGLLGLGGLVAGGAFLMAARRRRSDES